LRHIKAGFSNQNDCGVQVLENLMMGDHAEAFGKVKLI
jgi:hypothetical protein